MPLERNQVNSYMSKLRKNRLMIGYGAGTWLADEAGVGVLTSQLRQSLEEDHEEAEQRAIYRFAALPVIRIRASNIYCLSDHFETSFQLSRHRGDVLGESDTRRDTIRGCHQHSTEGVASHSDKTKNDSAEVPAGSTASQQVLLIAIVDQSFPMSSSPVIPKVSDKPPCRELTRLELSSCFGCPSASL